MEKNVVVAVFNVESEGFQALSELRQAAGGEKYLVSAAALVKSDNETCYYLDGFDTGVHTADDSMRGGLIGMLLGVLGGPLGVLLGGSFGSLIGSSIDAGDAAFGVSMLDQIADKLDDGMVALVALAGEETEDDLDALLGRFDTVIARFNAEAVADEVNRAYEKQAEMARQAKEEMYKEWSDQARKDLQDSIEQGTEKFKSDLAFTLASIKEIQEERKAEREAAREARQKELEKNEELLMRGFSK